MITPFDLGWGNPRDLTSADMVTVEIFTGHKVQLRNSDVGKVMAALVRRLRADGWEGPDAIADEGGYNDVAAAALGGFSMADIDVILRKLEVMRVGDDSGSFDPHDFASLEGVAKNVDAARDDIDWLKRAVKAIAVSTGAALPPQ